MNARILADTMVIMPVGGKATRAQAVTRDRIPKHLIEIGGKTVLTIMCQSLQRVGFRHFVFCVGHHHEQILAHLRQGAWRFGVEASYDTSIEEIPLGPDGAVLQAIDRLNLRGNALLIPGDTILPWEQVATMALRHAEKHDEITVGVTSTITPQNEGSDTYVSEVSTSRLCAYYPKSQPTPALKEGQKVGKSAAVTAIQVEPFARLCRTFLESQPQGALLNFRHSVLPSSFRRAHACRPTIWWGSQSTWAQLKIFTMLRPTGGITPPSAALRKRVTLPWLPFLFEFL